MLVWNRPRRCAGVALALALVLGACGGSAGGEDAGPGDAGRACTNDLDCDAPASGQFCDNRRCVAVCAGDPTGSPCNYGFASDWPPSCCTVTEQCCDVAFEREACLSRPCPFWCPRTTTPAAQSGNVCPVGTQCEYTRADQPDPGPQAGECAAFDGRCVADCPGEQWCTELECCGAGTECVDDCCVVIGIDAGLPDAGPPDAGT